MSEINLCPDLLNLRLWRGDGWNTEVTINNPDGTPMNLTGATIAGTIAPSIPLTITATNLAAGKFRFGQTAASESGRYDIQVTPFGGAPRTYIAGYITVADDVTP